MVLDGWFHSWSILLTIRYPRGQHIVIRFSNTDGALAQDAKGVLVYKLTLVYLWNNPVKYYNHHYQCCYPYHRESRCGCPQHPPVLVRPAKKAVLCLTWVFDVPALPCPRPTLIPMGVPGSLGWEARLPGRTDPSPRMGTGKMRDLVCLPWVCPWGWPGAYLLAFTEGLWSLWFTHLIWKINNLPCIIS